MSLPCALELHGNLRRARLASWNAFRAQWINLQLQKGVDQEQAEAVADRAKRKGYQLRLAKTVHDAVPESRSGLPAMSGEEIKTFIDYLEGLAAQQIWDQASPAQRSTVGAEADVQASPAQRSTVGAEADVAIVQDAARDV